jgi:hypothetical protein
MLLIAHQLSAVEKAGKLMDAPDLGDRRPSQMLADLLQLCPPGEHATAFFRAAFMKWLPAKVQVHLSGTEERDLKALVLRQAVALPQAVTIGGGSGDGGS